MVFFSNEGTVHVSFETAYRSGLEATVTPGRAPVTKHHA
jgi:hypothetical protein